ncbi:hypothetical protein DUI87_18686 [Hirundo rustica rustica]|uniref:Integrase catalytic domain-containing protein n=1 Tax=Hirundo rustica rustica TaxID=333673 RepID=A0A3M0JWV2_HIRRU|nr:hypothetical protein DUI87_18686 [Hirundo rustica rustica]
MYERIVTLSHALDLTIDSLVAAGFELQDEKIQRMQPWKYLGLHIDASGTSHKSVITWKDPQTQQWEKDIVKVEGSPQVAELAAVVRAFEKFPEPFNLVTDSANVTGEKSSDPMKHLIQAFSFLGIPKSIKTDNGPTYTPKEFGSFLQQWGVEHKTAIPYSPTGQAII